jgi:hypothetical protein
LDLCNKACVSRHIACEGRYMAIKARLGFLFSLMDLREKKGQALFSPFLPYQRSPNS